MVMGVVESRTCAGYQGALAGSRVLLTGLEAGHGVDIARAFADAGCRLVIQAPEMTPELDALLEELARSAEAVTISSVPLDGDAAALQFAQSAVKAFGGLDAVVNLARLDDRELTDDASLDEIERRVADTLGPAFRITDVIANRMQLTWTDGLILNIVTQAPARSAAAGLLGRIARAALAGMTRREAVRRSGQGIRINAIAPADDAASGARTSPLGMTSEPEIAALAVHLAASPEQALSGLVFDASGVGCLASH